MDRSGFDVEGFHAALDAQRVAKGLTWAVKGRPSQISSSLPRIYASSRSKNQITSAPL